MAWKSWEMPIKNMEGNVENVECMSSIMNDGCNDNSPICPNEPDPCDFHKDRMCVPYDPHIDPMFNPCDSHRDHVHMCACIFCHYDHPISHPCDVVLTCPF